MLGHDPPTAQSLDTMTIFKGGRGKTREGDEAEVDMPMEVGMGTGAKEGVSDMEGTCVAGGREEGMENTCAGEREEGMENTCAGGREEGTEDTCAGGEEGGTEDTCAGGEEGGTEDTCAGGEEGGTEDTCAATRKEKDTPAGEGEEGV